MENKLEEAIATKDWYSAHQLLLSLAQRHQRAKRLEAAKKLLVKGINGMCPEGDDVKSTWPPLASIVDIAEKYIEISEQDATAEHDNTEKEAYVKVFSSLLLACDSVKGTDDKHAGVWMDVSSKLLALRSEYSDALLEALFKSPIETGWKLNWCVENVPAKKEVFTTISSTFFLDSVIDSTLAREATVSVMQLLCVKAFGSAANLLKGVLDNLKAKHSATVAFTSVDDSAGSLPSFLSFVEESQGSANLALLNFSQLVFALCQRKSPSKALFVQLMERFKLSSDEEMSRLVAWLIKVYCPAPRANPQANMNPLASMFQNMFSGGAPGGFPGMMPPPQAPGKKTPKRNSNIGNDLD